jgi:uncharacterized protein YegL
MNKAIEIVFILDRSGSMSPLTNDTIGGYNSFIAKQKEEPGEAKLTTVLFSDQNYVLHDGVDLKSASDITHKEYIASGSTALLDAIGDTIKRVKDRIKPFKREYKPQVIMVITTDGEENSSIKYTKEQIQSMVKQYTEKGWKFIFLGANIDAISVASSIGIQYASNYTASVDGIKSVYTTMCSTVSDVRATGQIDDDWKDEII